jgi:cytoskeletal protein RodZ
MLRHLVILSRDKPISDQLTITLDRHLARWEQVEIVQDRRSPPSEPRVSQWPAGRERRRASPLAEQLHTQGYVIFSREEEAAVPTPRAFEPVLVGREERARALRDDRARALRDDRRSMRDRLSHDEDEELEDRYDLDDRDDLFRPRRRGGRLVAVLLVVGALAAGIVYFSLPSRDRLADVLDPQRPTAGTTARASRATEEGARVGSDATDRSAPAPPPATPAPATPVPAPPDATPSAATPSPAPPPPATPAREATPLPATPARETTASRAPDATPSSGSTRQTGAPTERAAPPETPARDLPPRASLPPRSTEAAPTERPQDPAPQPARTQKLPDFPGLPRVEVMRAASPGGTTFTVSVVDSRGRPLPDAEVWLRQQSSDGFVRETKLEPVSPAGSYRAAVPTDGRRPGALTLRLVLGDRRIEMPVGD